MLTIPAVYQNGVFKPKEPVSLPEGCEVSVLADEPSPFDLAPADPLVSPATFE